MNLSKDIMMVWSSDSFRFLTCSLSKKIFGTFFKFKYIDVLLKLTYIPEKHHFHSVVTIA